MRQKLCASRGSVILTDAGRLFGIPVIGLALALRIVHIGENDIFVARVARTQHNKKNTFIFRRPVCLKE